VDSIAALRATSRVLVDDPKTVAFKTRAMTQRGRNRQNPVAHFRKQQKYGASKAPKPARSCAVFCCDLQGTALNMWCATARWPLTAEAQSQQSLSDQQHANRREV
jgi:hypothetical protein